MTEVLPVSSLEPSDQELVQKALEVRMRAYAPYSHYLVGCAVRDISGRVHCGCNVENASYSAVICAERSALSSMVASGQKECSVLALITVSEDPVFPCGMCLQVLQELGRNARVIAANKLGSHYREATLKDLFPLAFSKEKLQS